MRTLTSPEKSAYPMLSNWAFPTSIFVGGVSHLLSFIFLPRFRKMINLPKPTSGIRFLGIKYKQYIDVISFVIFLLLLARLWPVDFRNTESVFYSGIFTAGVPLSEKFNWYDGHVLNTFLCGVALALLQLLLYWRMQKITLRMSLLCHADRPWSTLYDDKAAFTKDALAFIRFMKLQGLDVPNRQWFNPVECRKLMQTFDDLNDSLAYREIDKNTSANLVMLPNKQATHE